MARRFGICLMILIAANILVAREALTAGANNAVTGNTSGAADVDPVALLLFIGGRPQTRVPVPVAQLRRFTIASCEEALTASGFQVSAQTEMDRLRHKWRLRSDRTLSREFLADCRLVLGVRRLVIVTLISQDDHFLLLARALECPSGRLTSVAIEEKELSRGEIAVTANETDPATDIFWRQRLQDLVALTLAQLEPDLTDSTDPSPASALMLMLPATGIAVNAEATTTVTHLFMQQALGDHRWQMMDPSIVTASLLEAGLHPQRLGAEARMLLGRQFETDRIILAELISYDSNRTAGLATVDGNPAQEQRRIMRAFALAVRMVDLPSGNLAASTHLFVDPARRTGWFGRPFSQSLLQQLTTTAHELWLIFLAELEAS